MRDDTGHMTGDGIAIAGLTYEARGVRLIDIPRLTLPGAGITVIMGPNGAGKSLLLRLMHGLIAPGGGDIRFDGAATGAALRRNQALVFQKPVLLRRTAAANIDFVLKARGHHDPSACRALLTRVGLAAHADTPARRLSGGEQQRLAIARALATRPETLFLDEPTASLDPASVAAIETIVRDVARDGVRVIFVTHDIGQARRLARDVVFLSGGKVCEAGPAADFFENPQSPAARAYLAGRLDNLVEG